MDFGDKTTAEDIRARKGAFLADSCGDLSVEDVHRALTLIETQRMRMFMYTSCGWFFNDVAGIETRQIMAYALRASEYVKSLTGISLEEGFLEDLKKTPGNTAEYRTGYDVMMNCVMPLKRSVRDIAAASALMSSGSSYYAYRVKSGGRAYPSGDMGLSVARTVVTDTRTLETWSGASVVLSTGGLDDVCRLTEKDIPSQKEIWRNLYSGDMISLSRYIEESFEIGQWHFRDLPQDDRDLIAAERTKDAEQDHLQYAEELMADNRRLLVQLNMIGVESSPFLRAAVSFVYGQRMLELALGAGDILDLLKPESRLDVLLDEACVMGIYPEVSVLGPVMGRAFYDNLSSAMEKKDEETFANILFLWKRTVELKIEINRWRIQNKIWEILGGDGAFLSNTTLELARALGFATPETI
jgi:hypothetical protein